MDPASLALQQRLESLLALPPSEQEHRLDDLCHEHPGHRDQLQEWWRAMRALAVASSPTPVPAALPASIGPYRILDRLGEGGMGTVYIGEQKEPVHRRVAVKVVKLGMDTKAVLGRFESERQALALMNHPNIARVLDSGATDRGQPYFVMELVRGIPLTQSCDRNRLSIRERLELFAQVCSGVQHAHHKGVIHRDIKPSNILVEQQDGKATAKIIDFGLARATGGHRLSQHTVFTEIGQLIGTPEYMSPEQAEMAATDIDTRTDVYSLGVLLYQLLTGELPFSTDDLPRSDRDEIRRRIREETPPRPSTRITTVSRKTTEHAAERRTDPGSLVRRLRGDLDWITMKAMEKDRARRYQTPAELIADVERHLRSEPVLAGPPGVSYRVQKFVRRYRVQVAAAAVIVIALAAGLVISLVAWRSADAAEREMRRQRDAAQDAKADAERQRAAAQQAQVDLKTQRDNFLVLAESTRLERLTRTNRELWPATSQRAPAMTEWLKEAESLEARAPSHREQLRLLRARAVQAGDVSGLGWVFKDDSDNALHWALTRLVGEYDSFSAGVAEVKAGHEWATSVKKLTIDDHKEAWQRAIAEIAQDPNYRHLHLTEQVGLIPVGRDRASQLWEFAHPRSGDVPARHPRTGVLTLAERTGIVFVLLPGGQFTMGSQKVEAGGAVFDPRALPNEGPPQSRTLGAFFIAKHEVTQGQWARLCHGSNPSRYTPGASGGPSGITLLHPVERITWNDATRVLDRHGLLLPTEAQWEYACRAGTTTPWWSGAERNGLIENGAALNVADATAIGRGAPWQVDDWDQFDDGHVVHAPVGIFAANPFGLHDVMGNVSEWCRDAYGEYAECRATTDECLHSYPDTRSDRVVRGGSFSRGYLDARCARRLGVPADSAFDNVGLRPVRRIDP